MGNIVNDSFSPGETITGADLNAKFSDVVSETTANLDAVNVRAEGVETRPGANLLLHLHPVLNDADVYGHGRPTRLANSDHDVRQGEGSLPVTEMVSERVYSIPWFKHYRPEIIQEHAEAFRKVAAHANELA